MTQIHSPEMQPFFVLAQEINRRAMGESTDAQSLAQYIITAAGKLGGSIPDNAMMEWEASFDYYDALMDKRREDAKLPASERSEMLWAWRTWNNLLDPMEPGMLAVLSAGDGMGKTLVAETQAESWARQGYNVVFLHYELNKVLMTDRRASRFTGITRRTLKGGDLDFREERKLEGMRPAMLGYPGSILYIHSPGWTPDRTTQALHSLHVEGKCDVVVLDYLEKMGASDGQLKRFGHNAFQREADSVEQLKNFAESHEIPVLMLAQMSKAGKGTSFQQLDRTDIRGAGEKTEKANIVILLHREREEDGNYSKTVRIRIDKNTVGPPGSFEQYMDAAHFRIADFED